MAFLLRTEAETLAQQLAGLNLQVDAADTLYPGAASRKRAGSGEQFWQYRRYGQSDAASRIDWRRSARTEDFYVRETELETARTILFWPDPQGSFDWSSHPDLHTKAERAKLLMLSLGILLAGSGERIGMLSAPRSPSTGRQASSRLSDDFLHTQARAHPEPPRGQSLIVLASDFYDPVGPLTTRLRELHQSCRKGILLRITDPVEHGFSYTGRVRFSQPGTGLSRLFGRAEEMRETYLSAFEAQNRAIHTTAHNAGWHVVDHCTDRPPLEGATALLSAMIAVDAHP